MLGIEPRRAENLVAAPCAISTIGKPWRSRWRRSAGRTSSGSMPTTKRSWQRAQARGGTALTGVSGSPDFMASTSKEHQPKTCSAGVRPGSPQSGSIVRPVAARHRLRNRRARCARTAGSSLGHPFGDADLAGRRDDAWRCAWASWMAGIGEEAAPVAGMMAALARVDRQVEGDAAARAEEDRRPFGAQAAGRRRRSARRPRTARDARVQSSRRPGEPHLLAHLDQVLGVEAELAARLRARLRAPPC